MFTQQSSNFQNRENKFKEFYSYFIIYIINQVLIFANSSSHQQTLCGNTTMVLKDSKIFSIIFIVFFKKLFFDFFEILLI